MLVVRPDVAVAQMEQDRAVPQPTVATVAAADPVTGQPSLVAPLPRPAVDRRFFGVVALNPERYGRDFSRVAIEVLQHLTAVEGTKLEVTVEIIATNDRGFPPDKARVVTENARTLKFDQFGFEAE